MGFFDHVRMMWANMALSYETAFSVYPAAGWHIPRLFYVFDFCASLFVVLFMFTACFSLYLHLRILWMRHCLLRNLGRDEVLRLEAQA